jgi:hypothetical protein
MIPGTELRWISGLAVTVLICMNGCGDDTSNVCYPLVDPEPVDPESPPGFGEEPWCEWTVTTIPDSVPHLNGPYLVDVCDDLSTVSCDACPPDMDDRLRSKGEALFATFTAEDPLGGECVPTVDHFMRGCYGVWERDVWGGDFDRCCYRAAVWNATCVPAPGG